MVGCLPMSFNFSVRASARSFTASMVGIGLEVLSGLGLLWVVGSGLAGLPGLGGKEVTSECSEEDPLSVSSNGGGTGEGVSLVSLKSGVSGGRSFDSTGDLGLEGVSLVVGSDSVVGLVSVLLFLILLTNVSMCFLCSGVSFFSDLEGVGGGWTLVCLSR